MAVFKIEKTRDYTVMSNHHLRNASLSLKAKGLLSQMLSLPENWDYTLAGLSAINKESIDAIRTAVWELEKAGYVKRQQGRDDKGKLLNIEYTIYEQPLLENPTTDEKTSKEPLLDKPITDKPITDKPSSDNPMQLNKDISKKDIQKKESINPITGKEMDRIECELRTRKEYAEYFDRKVEYDVLLSDNPTQTEVLSEIRSLWIDTLSCNTKNKTVRISGECKSIEVVKAQFMKLTKEHILYALFCLGKQSTKIKNIKSYMLTVLYNAPMTIHLFYQTLVQHDMTGDSV